VPITQTPLLFEDFTGIGNLIEAMIWFAIAIVVFSRSLRSSSLKRLKRVVSANFFLFGLTDLVEMKTGAWWRPPWLLVLKAVCVASFVICFGYYRRTRRLEPGQK
jgi:hypothetical protein